MEFTDSAFVPQLLSIYMLYLGAAMIPGPNLFVISGASLGTSRAHGIATALGVSTGTVIFSVSALAGLSAVVATIPSVATAIRIWERSTSRVFTCWNSKFERQTAHRRIVRRFESPSSGPKTGDPTTQSPPRPRGADASDCCCAVEANSAS